jgi:hypothetical protein
MIDVTRSDSPPKGYGRGLVELLQQLKESGQPITLSLSGQAQIAVEDDKSFGKLLELVDWLESVEDLRERIKNLDAGEGISIEQAKEEANKRYGYSL